MLIVSRQPNESIVIQLGEKVIYVTLLEIQDNRAEVGIRAPSDVIIDREEVYRRKKRSHLPPSR
jgi:carbon storage regulator CsrA